MDLYSDGAEALHSILDRATPAEIEAIDKMADMLGDDVATNAIGRRVQEYTLSIKLEALSQPRKKGKRK
ncbi:MAG: hypothetical protein ACK5HX_36520 [Bradyrhizobium sp.]|jgi:hypothetical protein|uniref:hypothetical protein n=1 Tax=Bradyrhizobium sp. TaxID=376 RepID=UPI0003A0CAFC